MYSVEQSPHNRGVLFCRALLCAQKAGSWSDLHAMAFESVRLLLNVFKHAGFRSESCGIGGLCKVEDFPIMNATAMTISAMPVSGHWFSVAFRSETPEASLYFLIKACFYQTETLPDAIFPRLVRDFFASWKAISFPYCRREIQCWIIAASFGSKSNSGKVISRDAESGNQKFIRETKIG